MGQCAEGKIRGSNLQGGNNLGGEIILTEAGRDYIVYNETLLRCGEGLPFDHESEKWKGRLFACSYDDDLDREWNGFR